MPHIITIVCPLSGVECGCYSVTPYGFRFPIYTMRVNTLRERVFDDKDALIMIVGFFCLLAIPFLLWKYLRPEAPIVRHQIVATAPDGCKAEVWVRGKEGDRLVRMMQNRKHGPSYFTGVSVIHENNTSARVATEINTPQGRCEIVRWRLLVNGQQTDSLKRNR